MSKTRRILTIAVVLAMLVGLTAALPMATKAAAFELKVVVDTTGTLNAKMEAAMAAAGYTNLPDDYANVTKLTVEYASGAYLCDWVDVQGTDLGYTEEMMLFSKTAFPNCTVYDFSKVNFRKAGVVPNGNDMEFTPVGGAWNAAKVIPEFLPATQLYFPAFKNNDVVEEFIFGDGIEQTQDWQATGMVNLLKYSISDKMTYVGHGFLEKSAKLETTVMNFPSKAISIDYSGTVGVFAVGMGQMPFENFKMPEGYEVIRGWGMRRWDNMKGIIELPSTIKNIGAAAFEGSIGDTNNKSVTAFVLKAVEAPTLPALDGVFWVNDTVGAAPPACKMNVNDTKALMGSIYLVIPANATGYDFDSEDMPWKHFKLPTIAMSDTTVGVGQINAQAAPITATISAGGYESNFVVEYTYTGTGDTTYGPSTTAPTAVGTYSVTAKVTNFMMDPAAAEATANLTITEQTVVEHNVVAIAGANGTISPSGLFKVEDGADVTFTITPAEGYEVDKIMVNGQLLSEVSNSLTLTAVDNDVAVAVSFKLKAATPAPTGDPVSPPTGETATTMMFVVLMGLIALAGGVLVIRRNASK